ncbi:hypothetical protein Tco_1021138 [Tanacetum coccineum]
MLICVPFCGQAKLLAVRYLVKVSWNSKGNFELTWVWKDYLKDKYPRLIVWLVKLLVLTCESVVIYGVCDYMCLYAFMWIMWEIGSQSIECDHLNEIGMVIIREVFVKLLLDSFGKLSIRCGHYVSFMRILRLREVARMTARIALEFAPDYAFSVSLLLTPLCCDDIHDVTPRVSALAGCDRLVSEPLVIENSDPGPQCSTTVLEQEGLSPDPQSQENVSQNAETETTSNELELLYSPMFSELLTGTSPVVSKSSAIHR